MALFYRACVYDGDKSLFRDDAENYHSATNFCITGLLAELWHEISNINVLSIICEICEICG